MKICTLSKCFFLLMLIAGFNVNAQTKTKTSAKQPVSKQQTTASQETPHVDENPKPVIAPSGKEVVAVYPFSTTRDYNYDYAMNAGNAVEAGFVRSTRFVVVERSRFGTISEEDKFKEANTSEVVKQASRFGAKTVVTGQIVGVSKGDVVDYQGKLTGNRYAEISVSFKIIDVETSQIKLSEIIRGKGEDPTDAGALQYAYQSIDKLVRSYIAYYLPQRFKFMSVVSTGTKKDGPYLEKFKIWGGSDNGLNVGDAVELYSISSLINPDTKQKVEEKQLLGEANVLEINSGSTATCTLLNARRIGNAIVNAMQSQPDNIMIEYKGNTVEKPKSVWDILGN